MLAEGPPAMFGTEMLLSGFLAMNQILLSPAKTRVLAKKANSTRWHLKHRGRSIAKRGLRMTVLKSYKNKVSLRSTNEHRLFTTHPQQRRSNQRPHAAACAGTLAAGIPWLVERHRAG